MSDQEHRNPCNSPVPSEPVKEEIVAHVESAITEHEPTEKPQPEDTTPRRRSFAATDRKKGSGGLDSLGKGNLP
jgi:hypothetical protein